MATAMVVVAIIIVEMVVAMEFNFYALKNRLTLEKCKSKLQ